MGHVSGADVWGLRPLARARRAALPDGLTLHVEMLRLLVMFDRSGWRQIRQALETGMAGEIRAAMAALKVAKEKMIAELAAEINAVGVEVAATKADGLDALKLPRAELALTKAEIREIREEFAPKSNGAPPGPLPGATTSGDSSGASVTSASLEPVKAPDPMPPASAGR